VFKPPSTPVQFPSPHHTWNAGSIAIVRTQGKRPSRPDPDGSDPRVAQLEAKLEELKTLGDRIKQRAVSALCLPVLVQWPALGVLLCFSGWSRVPYLHGSCLSPFPGQDASLVVSANACA